MLERNVKCSVILLRGPKAQFFPFIETETKIKNESISYNFSTGVIYTGPPGNFHTGISTLIKQNGFSLATFHTLDVRAHDFSLFESHTLRCRSSPHVSTFILWVSGMKAVINKLLPPSVLVLMSLSLYVCP